MSDNKRKRSEDHYQTQSVVQANSILQQPIVLHSVVHGEQVGEQVQVVNGTLATAQNAQSNLYYIILPSGVNQAQNLIQGVPVLLMQKDEQVTSENPPQLHYYVSEDKTNVVQKTEEDDDVIFIKNVKTVKNEEMQAYLAEPEVDPLQVQVNTVHHGSNVSYTLVPQYEEVQQQSTEGVFVLDNGNYQEVQPVEVPAANESMKWKTQFKCDFPGCLVTFPSIYEKKLHAETHIFPANTEFKCSICNMVFERATERNKHVDSHAVINTYKCKMCEKTFPYYTSLVKHMNEEKCAVSKSFACSFCGVQFVDDNDLDKHQKCNMKLCVCRARICSDQAFELHTSLCVMYKQNARKNKGTARKKKTNSNDVILLD